MPAKMTLLLRHSFKLSGACERRQFRRDSERSQYLEFICQKFEYLNFVHLKETSSNCNLLQISDCDNHYIII